MNNKTLFVIWMLMYPLVTQVCTYLSCYIRIQQGKEPFTESVMGLTALVNIVIYFYVAAKLWSND